MRVYLCIIFALYILAIFVRVCRISFDAYPYKSAEVTRGADIAVSLMNFFMAVWAGIILWG